jgi:hypothetical protein
LDHRKVGVLVVIDLRHRSVPSVMLESIGRELN